MGGQIELSNLSSILDDVDDILRRYAAVRRLVASQKFIDIWGDIDEDQRTHLQILIHMGDDNRIRRKLDELYGKIHTDNIGALTARALRDRASGLKIKYYTTMDKPELLSAIMNRERQNEEAGDDGLD